MADGPRVWQAAREAGARLVGSRAHESLRIEAGTPYLGHDVDETVLLPVKADAGLVAVAEQVARDHPELGATPFHYRGLYSELSIASVHGQKALGLLNFDPRTKMPPHFHTARDTMSNIDPEVLAKSEQFAWAILQHLDAA
jgi:hypothetical protein